MDIALRVAAEKGFADLLIRFLTQANARFGFSDADWKDPSTGRNSSIGNASLKKDGQTLISIRIYNPDETGKKKFNDLVIRHGELLVGFRSHLPDAMDVSDDAFKAVKDLHMPDAATALRYYRFTSQDQLDRLFAVL